jgi:hypothetical protein
MLSVDDTIDLEGVGLRWAGRLTAHDKISPLLKDSRNFLWWAPFVVEFYPDVDYQEARALAQGQGLLVLDHPDLAPNQLLIRGFFEQLPRLAEWDEVSYIFPASDDLVQGQRVEACAGAIAPLGAVGQYVAKIGEGWDGPGRNSAELGYFFEKLTKKLPPDEARQRILKAMQEWAKYASLTFFPAAGAASPRTLNILFAPGNHGDPFPFDGPSRVLAHTYYPAPPNPEPIAGDIHFDEDESWVAGPDVTIYSVDLFSVALHELGHALGLGHSDLPGTVMYPYYRRAIGLAPLDIASIQELYAAPGAPPDDEPPTETPPSSPPPEPPPEPPPLSLQIQRPAVFPLTTTADSLSISGTVTGGAGVVQVTWVSDRGAGGVAQGGRSWSIPMLPLQIGNNVVTITASDQAQKRVSYSVFVTRRSEPESIEIRITSPTSGATYTSTSSTIVLAGTASPASGLARIRWTNSRGGNGLASGTGNWTTGPLILKLGTNLITLTAYGSSGRSASCSLEVTYVADIADTVAPYLRILFPTSTNVLTYSSTIAVRGMATDNVGVTEVTWSTSTGKSGVATGTTNWTTGDIPLLIGTNRIVVRARDSAGNVGWRSLTVTRR